MKSTRLFFSFCLFSLILVSCNMPGAAGSTDEATGGSTKALGVVPGTEDGIYAVQFYAAPGVLQGHSRSESEYADLAQGPSTLSSGSFLRTLNGEAFVLLPGDSVMKMGAYTEVQVGLYEDGIMILQNSGNTLHVTAPGREGSYIVATPFETLEALGTEFEVRIDYPAQGWVAVYWGEIGIVETDPHVVYGLVPEGVMLLGPGGTGDYFRIQPGDTIGFSLDPTTGQPRLGDRNRIPADAVAQHNRDLAMRIRALQDDYTDGIITREEFFDLLNEVVNDVLGLGDPVVVPEEEQAWDITTPFQYGGLYGGMAGNNVVTLCYDGSAVTRVTWSTEMMCTDKETSDMYNRSDVFSMGLDALMLVGSGGSFNIGYQVDPAISVNTTWEIVGTISSGGGNVTMYLQSDSDVEFCETGFVTLPLRPLGTNCSGQ